MLYSVAETIKFSNPIEATACTTGRTGFNLAQAYGYLNVRDLCIDIPDDANVLDAGAGLSNLGHDVAKLRPDINWYNFDARYGADDYPKDEQDAIAEMAASAPSNVSYVGGNVFELPIQVRARRYSTVFSYYMFPHIIDYFGKSAASKAMYNLLALLTSDGTFHTGPNRYTDDAWSVSIANEPRLSRLADKIITRYTESYSAYERRYYSAS